MTSKRIALIGCSASKRNGTHPAREIYTGSLFTGVLAVVEAQLHHRYLDAAFILSARHGLLRLDEPIAAYDQHMTSDVIEGVAWGKRVDEFLCAEVPHGDGVEVTIYAGADYLRFIPVSPARRLILPLAHLGIGEQKALVAGLMKKLGVKREKPAPKPRGARAQHSTISRDHGSTVADLVLALDAEYPGASDAEMCLPGWLWSKLVTRAVIESEKGRAA